MNPYTHEVQAALWLVAFALKCALMLKLFKHTDGFFFSFVTWNALWTGACIYVAFAGWLSYDVVYWTGQYALDFLMLGLVLELGIKGLSMPVSVKGWAKLILSILFSATMIWMWFTKQSEWTWGIGDYALQLFLFGFAVIFAAAGVRGAVFNGLLCLTGWAWVFAGWRSLLPPRYTLSRGTLNVLDIAVDCGVFLYWIRYAIRPQPVAPLPSSQGQGC